MSEAVVTGTTEAIRTIFRLLLLAVLAGMAATAFLPALELCATSDAAAAGPFASER